MPHHSRIRKTVKWGSAIATVVLAVVWIGSGWWYIGRWTQTGSPGWSIAGGEFLADWSWPATSPWHWVHDPHVDIGPGQFTWNAPDLYWGPWTYAVLIPLWLPTALSFGAAAAAWWPRRRHQNSCPSCSYDRAGLAPFAPCPECGHGSGARDV